MNDALERARRAYEQAGRDCVISMRRSEEPWYATVTELAARLGPEGDMLMLLTAISEAVERYDPEREAVSAVTAPLPRPSGPNQVMPLYQSAPGQWVQPCSARASPSGTCQPGEGEHS